MFNCVKLPGHKYHFSTGTGWVYIYNSIICIYIYRYVIVQCVYIYYLSLRSLEVLGRFHLVPRVSHAPCRNFDGTGWAQWCQRVIAAWTGFRGPSTPVFMVI